MYLKIAETLQNLQSRVFCFKFYLAFYKYLRVIESESIGSHRAEFVSRVQKNIQRACIIWGPIVRVISFFVQKGDLYLSMFVTVFFTGMVILSAVALITIDTSIGGKLLSCSYLFELKTAGWLTCTCRLQLVIVIDQQ